MSDPKGRIAGAPARVEGSAVDAEWLRGWLDWLTVTVLPGCQAAAAEAEEKVNVWRGRYYRLTPSQIGYVTSMVLVGLIVAAVSLFDAFVIHSALEHAGLGEVALWGTTLTVPLAVWAINHSMGLVAGAIAIRMRAERVRLAVIAFVSGVGALLGAFVLLAIFRDQSIGKQNRELKDFALTGNVDNLDSFFISPLWLGPVQIAASIAAISAVALWTAGRAGREVRELLAAARADFEAATALVRATEAKIESARLELRQALLRPFEVRADAAAAEVEIETIEDVMTEREAQERARAESNCHLYEAEFVSTNKIFENGDVWLQAMPSEERLLSRRVTPDPTVGSSVPEDPADDGWRPR